MLSRVIDLDEAGHEDAPRPTGGRGHVVLAAVALLLFVLVSLTGLPNPVPSLSRAWSGEARHGFLWVDGRSVYTLRRAADGLLLTASDLATGSVRWQRPLTGSLARMYLAEAPILVPMFGPHVPARASTAASSTATGRLRGIYPVPAMPLVYFTDPVAIVIDRVPGAEPTGPGPGGPNQIGTAEPDSEASFDGWLEAHQATAIDLDSGAPRWVRTIEPGSTWALPGVHPWREGFVGERGSAPWMAVVGPTGAAEIWRLDTGRVQARADVGALEQWSYTSALRGTFIVNAGGWPDAIVAGYDPENLDLVWRLPLPSVPDLLSWPVTCAELVCLVSSSDVWAVDLTAGKLIWRQPVADVYAVGDRTLAAATIADGPVLLDVATGGLRAVPGGWRVAESRTGEGPLILFRPNRGRYTLGLLPLSGVDAGVPASLGDAGPMGLPERCELAGTHLVCTHGVEVQVWRVRQSVVAGAAG